MKSVKAACVAGAVLGLSGVTCAQYVPGEAMIDPGLSGAVQYDGWVGMTAANYPGYGAFPGTAMWPGPIGSNRTPGNVFSAGEPGDAGVMKVANGAGGGAIPMSEGVYFGGFSSTPNTFGGVLAVMDATPVAGLENIVFQVQIGEALTFDFFNEQLPTLSYNGGSQALAPTTSIVLERFFNGTVQMPTGKEPLYNNTYLLQWDLRGIAAPIEDFTIGFAGVQHAQVYGMALHQSDVYTPVPAPSAVGVLGAAAALGFRRAKR